MSLHSAAVPEQMRCKESSRAQPFSKFCATSCDGVTFAGVKRFSRALTLFRRFPGWYPELIQRDLLIEIGRERVLAVHPRELYCKAGSSNCFREIAVLRVGGR